MAIGNDQSLNIIIRAKNEASKVFSKMQKDMKTFQNKVKAMKPTFQKMAVAGTVAFTAIAAGVIKSVKAFQEQERAEARLIQLTKNVIQITGEQVEVYKDLATWNEAVNRAVEKSVEALKDQAVALQKVGVIGDEVTIFGQSQLATFQLQTDAIKTLTPAMLDMVVATKGVNATQQDMIDIGNMLGKVMGGQVGALSRVGVVFNETQEEILKTGTEMEKASALAEILTQNFGGLNEAARLTSEGAMKALTNTFGDLKEALGGVFVSSLAEVANKITPLLEKMIVWIENNPKLTKTIILVTGAMAGLVAVAGLLGLAFIALNGTIIIITAAVGAIIAVGVLLISNWEKIKERAENIWGSIKEFFVNSFNAIKDAVNEAIDNMVDALQRFWDRFGDLISYIAGLIVGLYLPTMVKMTARTIASLAKQVAAWVVSTAKIGAQITIQAVKSIPKLIAKYALLGTKAVTTAAKVVVGWVTMGAKSLINAAKMASAWLIAMGPIAWVSALVIGLVVLIIRNWEAIKEKTVAIFTAIGEFFVSLWEGIKTLVVAFFDFFVDMVTRTFDTYVQIFTAIKDFIVNIFTEIVTAVIEKWNKIKETTAVVWDGIKQKFASFGQGVKDIFKGIANSIIGYAEGFANIWIKAINTIITGLNKIQIKMPAWAGGKSFGINIPLIPEVSLPSFEHGGIVPGAVGQAVPILAHGQERILPANQSGGIGGNTFIVNLNNPIVRSREDINVVREQVELAFRDVVRVHKLKVI